MFFQEALLFVGAVHDDGSAELRAAFFRGIDVIFKFDHRAMAE